MNIFAQRDVKGKEAGHTHLGILTTDMEPADVIERRSSAELGILLEGHEPECPVAGTFVRRGSQDSSELSRRSAFPDAGLLSVDENAERLTIISGVGVDRDEIALGIVELGYGSGAVENHVGGVVSVQSSRLR